MRMSITSRNRHLHIVSQICSSSKPNSWKMVESSAASLSNYSNLFWFYFVLIVCCNYDFVVDFALVPHMFLHFLLPSYQAYEHLWAMHSDKKTHHYMNHHEHTKTCQHVPLHLPPLRTPSPHPLLRSSFKARDQKLLRGMSPQLQAEVSITLFLGAVHVCWTKFY